MSEAKPAPRYSVDLPDRVLVTGAAGAIGSAIVARLAADGVEVIATDIARRPAGSRAAAWVEADLASARERAALVAGIADLGGLVHAAGVIDGADWTKVDEAEFDRIFALNVKAPFFLCRGLLPVLRPGAAVVMVGSIASLRASPNAPFYAASKAALRNLRASLSAALASSPVRVNVLAPGLIDTPLTDRLNTRLALASGKSEATVAAERAAAVPAGRAGSVEEVAESCAFLLSTGASYLSGSTIFAAGGVLAGIT